MAHVLSMFDSEWLHAYDLGPVGTEARVMIEAVKAGTLTAQGGRKSKKPCLKFAGKEKELALNKTNAKVLISLYGAETEAWVKKWIILFVTTTEMAGETVECIRIRPRIPAGRPANRPATTSRPAPAPASTSEREPGDDGPPPVSGPTLDELSDELAEMEQGQL